MPKRRDTYVAGTFRRKRLSCWICLKLLLPHLVLADIAYAAGVRLLQQALAYDAFSGCYLFLEDCHGYQLPASLLISRRIITKKLRNPGRKSCPTFKSFR